MPKQDGEEFLNAKKKEKHKTKIKLRAGFKLTTTWHSVTEKKVN